LFFSPIFCEAFKQYLRPSAQIWLTFEVFLLYFVIFFFFLEFLGKVQIWTTGTWNHIIWRFKKWYSKNDIQLKEAPTIFNRSSADQLLLPTSLFSDANSYSPLVACLKGQSHPCNEPWLNLYRVWTLSRSRSSSLSPSSLWPPATQNWALVSFSLQ
jgi:hypothetical protein